MYQTFNSNSVLYIGLGFLLFITPVYSDTWGRFYFPLFSSSHCSEDVVASWITKEAFHWEGGGPFIAGSECTNLCWNACVLVGAIHVEGDPGRVQRDPPQARGKKKRGERERERKKYTHSPPRTPSEPRTRFIRHCVVFCPLRMSSRTKVWGGG